MGVPNFDGGDEQDFVGVPIFEDVLEIDGGCEDDRHRGKKSKPDREQDAPPFALELDARAKEECLGGVSGGGASGGWRCKDQGEDGKTEADKSETRC